MLPDTPFRRLSREELPEHMRPVHDHALRLHGDTTFIDVMGAAPETFDFYMNDFYKRLFYSGRIDKAIVELVRLRLANIHGCAMCNRGDRIAALEAGIDPAQIEALSDYETGPFNERERAALALADVMALTNAKGTVTPELHARLRAQFDDKALVELGVIMAMLCGMAKFLFAYDLVEKEDYCPFTPMAAE